MRRKYSPYPLRPEHIAYLLDNKLVAFDRENQNGLWLGVVLTFNGSQTPCFAVLFENFRKGNLPIPNQRVMSASRGSSTHISDIFKRTDAWKKDVIVGDGRGNFWLNIPLEVIRHLDGIIGVPGYVRAFLKNSEHHDRQRA